MPKRTSVRLTKTVVDGMKRDSFLWDSQLPGFGVRCTAAGTKSYVVQWRTATGKQGRTVIGDAKTLTVEEAREAAHPMLSLVEKRGDPTAAKRALREAPTVNDLAEHYLGDYAAARGLRPKTVNDARGVLKLALREIGRTKVAEVTKPDIRRLHGEARRNGKATEEARAKAAQKAEETAIKRGDQPPPPHRPKANPGVYQANRLLAVLSKMFTLAIELEWRTDNPCLGIKKFPEDQRRRRLTDSEVASLLLACDDHHDQAAANAIRLLLYTGARLQEVLRADWGQFDLVEGVWEKPSAHTKTKIQHRVDLAGPVLTLLREMHAADRDGRYLFPGDSRKFRKKGSEERPRADLKAPWRDISKAASIGNVRLHDLRRTTASMMLSSGASLATVGKQLGHTQAVTTQRYAYLSDDVQRKAAKAVGERMEEIKRKAKAAKVVNLR